MNDANAWRREAERFNEVSDEPIPYRVLDWIAEAITEWEEGEPDELP